MLVTLLLTALDEATAKSQRQVRIAERPEVELLLLGLRLGHVDLDVVLPVYPSRAGILVPVGSFCRALGVAVELDTERGWASVKWDHGLSVDAATGEVRVGSRVLPCDSTIEVHRDDIFLPAPLLAAWTSLRIEVDLSASALTVRSTKPLPIQEQAARRQRGEQLLAAESSWQTPYPRLEAARRPWSLPFIDQTVRSTTLRSGDMQSTRWDYTTFLAGELLYLEADARLYGDQDRVLSEVAAGIGRREADPVLLGPLRAREIRAGEFFCPGLPLVTVPAVGTGGLLSSFPLQRPSQFDRHAFRGRLPPGWDVELYRDQELVALQTSRPDDTYEFEAPLTFGPNPFRLVFHGPHGERREEARVIYVGSELTSPGQHHYRVAFCDPRSVGARAQVEADVSLARRLSLALSAARVALDDGTELYGGAGIRASWRQLFLTGDFAVDSSGGRAFEAGLQTLWGPLGLTFRQAVLRRFRSEVFRPTLGPITGRSSARVDGVLPLMGARLPLQAELLLDRHADGPSAWHLANRIGFGFGRFALSHAMRRVLIENTAAPVEPDCRNTFLVSAQQRRWALRGALEYDPRQLERPLELSLTTEGPLLGGTFAVLGINRNPQVDETRGVFSLRRNEGPLGWSVRTEQGERSGTSVSVALTIGINHDQRTGRWHSHASPVAGRGAASAQVFLDLDGNGRRDSAEPPVEHATFVIGHSQSPVHTGPDGTAFLSGLSGDPEVAVALAASSLEDPLCITPRPGFRFVPRPGQSVLLEFPVRLSGEVWGTVRLHDQGRSRPASGVALELVDEATGLIARQTTTAYDGFYELIGILPGQYVLRVAIIEGERRGLRARVSRALSIPAEGAVLENIDLLLEAEAETIATGDEDTARPDRER